MSRRYTGRRGFPPQRHRSAASFSMLGGLQCDSSMLLEDQTVILQMGMERGNNMNRVVMLNHHWFVDDTLMFDSWVSGGERGLSQETIEKQMRSRIHEACAADEEAVCVVCQDQLGRKYGRIARLDCGHRYHPQCIQTWLSRNNTCPLCKATALSAS